MKDVSRMPLVRRIVNRYMSNKISRVCGQEIPDTQCGFRMLHRDLIPELLGGANRFDYETEMLIIASRKGYRIDSVPISTVYSDEVSSIHPVRDTIRFFKLMRRYQAVASLSVLATKTVKSNPRLCRSPILPPEERSIMSIVNFSKQTSHASSTP